MSPFSYPRSLTSIKKLGHKVVHGKDSLAFRGSIISAFMENGVDIKPETSMMAPGGIIIPTSLSMKFSKTGFIKTTIHIETPLGPISFQLETKEAERKIIDRMLTKGFTMSISVDGAK